MMRRRMGNGALYEGLELAFELLIGRDAVGARLLGLVMG
jgi:hypothetical protein